MKVALLPRDDVPGGGKVHVFRKKAMGGAGVHSSHLQAWRKPSPSTFCHNLELHTLNKGFVV